MDLGIKLILVRLQQVREHIETLYGDVEQLINDTPMETKEFQVGMFLGMSMVAEQLMTLFPDLLEEE
mgnify:FL=1|tara:strand:+ start:484 stop:684 length:201 start_codon:yes stop_codon:yes gene_type:complete